MQRHRYWTKASRFFAPTSRASGFTGIASLGTYARGRVFLPVRLAFWYNCADDTGTEELAHFEIVAAIVHQLTRDMSVEDVKKAGLETYFVDHTAGVYPQFASGTPFTASVLQVKGDVIADLNEDLAAEQKARVTYDNILRMSDDPDVNNVIRFLREREIVHYQRFGEGLRLATERMNQKNVYAINPSFDRGLDWSPEK